MKNLIQIIIPTVAIALAVGTSCKKTNAEDLVVVEEEDTVSNNTSNLCEPEGLYLTEVKPIIEANCVSCHAPSQSVDYIPLDTHTDLVANSGSLMSSINQDGSALAMPQGAPKLSDCDIQTIQKWVDANMPDN